MTTEMDKLKEFAICSIDELRDEEVRMEASKQCSG